MEDSRAIRKKCDVQTKDGVLDLIAPCCFEQTRHSLASTQPRLQPQIRGGESFIVVWCYLSALCLQG